MVFRRLRQSKTSRAGLVFPVTKARNNLKKFHSFHNRRVSFCSGIYTAGVLEYLVAELMELAGNACKSLHRKRIVPRHLMLAIRNDAELNKLLTNVTIPQAGVMPFIPSSLLPSKTTKNVTGAALPKVAVKKAVGKKAAPKRKQAAQTVASRGSHPVVAVATPTSASQQHRPKMQITILSEKQLHGGQKLTVLKGDIATIQADAVVHPTSSNYPTAGFVGSALIKQGGNAMRLSISSLASQGALAANQAKECPAHGLGADWVINCNGPSWSQSDAAGSVKNLEKAVKNCLSLAETKNFKSIAFPSIGSGRASFPKQTAAQTILQTIHGYFAAQMTSSIKQVYFVLFDQESLSVYTSELDKLAY